MDTNIDMQLNEFRAIRIRRVIAEHLGLELSAVTDDKSLAADFGADSLDLVELTMALEDEFNIEIPDIEADAAISVGDAVKLVQKYMAL